MHGLQNDFLNYSARLFNSNYVLPLFNCYINMWALVSYLFSIYSKWTLCVCQRRYNEFIKTFPFPSEKAGELFSSVPLKLVMPPVLSSGHQNLRGKDLEFFWVSNLEDLCSQSSILYEMEEAWEPASSGYHLEEYFSKGLTTTNMSFRSWVNGQNNKSKHV